MSREAMKQALEALENAEKEGNCEYGATELLRAALAQPEQAPAAWITKWEHQGSRGTVVAYEKQKHYEISKYIPLYTRPQPAAWVKLTEDEIDQGLCRTNYAMQTAGAWRDGVEWAMNQLKEKNR